MDDDILTGTEWERLFTLISKLVNAKRPASEKSAILQEMAESMGEETNLQEFAALVDQDS